MTQRTAQNINTVTLLQIAANNNETTYCIEHICSYIVTNSSK